MNIIYVAKNPSPVPQTITIPKGKTLGNSGVVSRESITVQVPPRSMREIKYDEFGNPISEGCIQDLIIAEIHQQNTPLDVLTNRKESTLIGHVSGDHRDYYYDKALELYPQLEIDNNKCIGGAQLLAQFSHLRSVRENTTAMYSPAALNMTFSSRTDSLYHAAKTGQVFIENIVGNGHNRVDAIQMDIHNPSSEVIKMIVPKGAMFEQVTWNGYQNLVVNDDVWIEIQPGQTGNFSLPAYCANAGAHSPSNNRMNLTPFVFQDMGGTFNDQNSMWRTTDSERNVRL
jgi:hypothetical protein